jgi:hypothetical protein
MFPNSFDQGLSNRVLLEIRLYFVENVVSAADGPIADWSSGGREIRGLNSGRSIPMRWLWVTYTHALIWDMKVVTRHRGEGIL